MFLDIGAGILIAIWVQSTHALLFSWSFVIAGAVFALLPDLDFIVPVIAKRGFEGLLRHREGLHYPLLYIPIGAFIFTFFGVQWAELFVLASCAHFLHDSIGLGWGVQWLYPFTKDHYSFFYMYKPRFRPEKLPRKIFYVWKDDEIEALDVRFGDPDWIKNVYFKWHPYAIVEFLVFLAALVVLYIHVR